MPVAMPGRRVRAVFERAVTQRNSMNEPVETWAQLAEVTAGRKSVSDAEQLRAAEVQATLTDRFVVLKSDELSDLAPKDRIRCEGRTFDIGGVKILDGHPPRLEITATARAE